MLLFRAEEHVDRWCAEHDLGIGAIFSLEQGWALAREWFRTRLAPDWRRRTVDEAEDLFAQLGFKSDFWSLRAPSGNP